MESDESGGDRAEERDEEERIQQEQGCTSVTGRTCGRCIGSHRRAWGIHITGLRGISIPTSLLLVYAVVLSYVLWRNLSLFLIQDYPNEPMLTISNSHASIPWHLSSFTTSTPSYTSRTPSNSLTPLPLVPSTPSPQASSYPRSSPRASRRRCLPATARDGSRCGS